MPILDHFGLLAPLYEVFIKPRHPEALHKLLDLPIRGALLDAGGGTGRVSQFLQEDAEFVSVVDLSCKMLQEAHKKRKLNPVCSHTETLPFPAQHFERIIMVDALHHVCDQSATARELWRVLKPGGKIIIEEPDVNRFAVKLVAAAEKIALMRSHFLSPERIEALFTVLDAEVETEMDDHIARIVITKKDVPSGQSLPPRGKTGTEPRLNPDCA